MQFPATDAFGKPAQLVAISTIAKQHKSTPDTVYAILQRQGIEPAVVLPFSVGFMRQYRVDDVEKSNLGGLLDILHKGQRAAASARMKETRKKSLTPAVRAKATATRAANKAEKDKAELKLLRKLAKAVKALGLGA